MISWTTLAYVSLLSFIVGMIVALELARRLIHSLARDIS